MRGIVIIFAFLTYHLLKSVDKFLLELYKEPFFFFLFFIKNIHGILTTVIFHLLVFIVLIGMKLHTLRAFNESAVVMDFDYKYQEDEEKVLLTPEELAKIELLERFLETSLRQSNQAVNVSSQLEKQISTSNFVDQVKQDLDNNRSIEEKEELEKLEERISVAEITEVPEEIVTEENQDYQGPTRITYEFLEPPYNRIPVHLPVPIYKCRGGGVVEVAIQVDLSGRVISAKPSLIGSSADGQCLAEAAVKYALLARFSKPGNAPSAHKGKITYSFVAQ